MKEKIKGSTNFVNGQLPNTMIYERAIFENHTKKDIRQTELHIKNSIAEILFSIETNEFYNLLFDLKCKNYLTTNYDYAFKNAILEMENFKSYNQSTEDIYSIRRQANGAHGTWHHRRGDSRLQAHRRVRLAFQHLSARQPLRSL